MSAMCAFYLHIRYVYAIFALPNQPFLLVIGSSASCKNTNMKISIVTPTWNSAETLRDTLESVLRQDYAHFEHIVVDGGSSDGTLDILREYSERYGDRIRWISEPDEGIYDAMNKGIEMCTGDVVGVLNSDDFFTSSDALSTIAAGIGKHDAVYGDIHYVDPADVNAPVRYYSSALFRRWKMRFGFMPAHPSFYCRKRIYTDYGLYDNSFRIAADFEMLLRLIYLHRIDACYIPKDFVTMRTGGASTSGFRSHRAIVGDHLRAYRKNGVHSNVAFEFCRYCYRIWEKIRFLYS